MREFLRGIEDLKLAFVNQAAQAWVEQDYHRKEHREIQTTPLDRMLSGHDVSRPAPDSDSLRLAFTRRITRIPRRSDATVAVDGIRYELPVRFEFGGIRGTGIRGNSGDGNSGDTEFGGHRT